MSQKAVSLRPLVRRLPLVWGEIAQSDRGFREFILEVRPDRAFQGSMPTATLRHLSTTCHPARSCPLTARSRPPTSPVGLRTSRSSAIRCTPFSLGRDVHTVFSVHPAFPFQTGSSG